MDSQNAFSWLNLFDYFIYVVEKNVGVGMLLYLLQYPGSVKQVLHY